MMTDRHLSSLELDQLALGGLEEAASMRARAHLASCPTCRAEDAAAAEHRAHFLVDVLPRLAPRPAPRWRRTWLALPVLAAAAFALVLATRPHASPPELGIKGAAAWQVFANRDGKTFAAHSGVELAAGDRIRFVVTPAGAAYLIVASVDGAGTASIYYPYDGAQSGPAPGPRRELPGSIVLDAAPGPERLFAVFSEEPIATAVVLAQLRDLGRRGADAIRGARSIDIAGARAELTLMFEKKAAP